MLENFIKFENHKFKKRNLKFKCFLTYLKISIFFLKTKNFHKISKLSKISYYLKQIQNDKIFQKFQKFHSFHKISKLRVK
jgi:NADH:ubiquinone oxidoreductase subunit C